MGIYRRSRTHKANKDISKRCRLRRRTKDLDQIQTDMMPQNIERVLKDSLDEELPGGGEFLCVECSRHFIDKANLDLHKGTKLHKKRVKNLSEPAYTIEEANAAGGSGSSDFYTKRVEKLKGTARESKKDAKKEGNDLNNASSMMSYE